MKKRFTTAIILCSPPNHTNGIDGLHSMVAEKAEKGQGCKQQGNHAASACTAD